MKTEMQMYPMWKPESIVIFHLKTAEATHVEMV